MGCWHIHPQKGGCEEPHRLPASAYKSPSWFPTRFQPQTTTRTNKNKQHTNQQQIPPFQNITPGLILCSTKKNHPISFHKSHRIHVWNINLHLKLIIYGKFIRKIWPFALDPTISIYFGRFCFSLTWPWMESPFSTLLRCTAAKASSLDNGTCDEWRGWRQLGSVGSCHGIHGNWYILVYFTD